MADLSHWDHAPQFSAHEVACLVMGEDPETGYVEKSLSPILRRIEADYNEAGTCIYEYFLFGSWTIGQEKEIAPMPKTALKSSSMERLLCLPLTCRKSYIGDWCDKNLDGSRKGGGKNFFDQQFSRKELTRWISENGIRSIYNFSPCSSNANDAGEKKESDAKSIKNSECSNQATINERDCLKTRERNTLLTIIAALCKEAKIDYNTASKAANLIQGAAASLGVNIGETTIEGHLKKIPDALESRMK